jgi:hypothetical protein
MAAIELKKLLIHRIAEINDEAFLNAIKIILDSKTNTQILNLTAEQKADVTESKKQFEQGLFIEQGQLDKEFNKWLSAR